MSDEPDKTNRQIKRRLDALHQTGTAPGDAAKWIAVLPLGATEQHGPHLPFETDTLIAEALVERLGEQLGDSAPVVFLPVEEIGYSPEHMFVPGTKTLEWDQAIRRWVRIGEQAHRSGIRKFVMLNAHGGNSPLMTIVATELRVRFNMLAVATSWTRFGLPDGILSAEEKHLDIHGGLIETSVMLALHPDRVDMRHAANFDSRQSEFIETYAHLRAYGPHSFGWQMSDLSASGVAGDASRASAQNGEAILAHAVNGLVELLRDVERHPGF
ncbi:creatininase family protein [Oricola cellulosilytica]|uniref:Creatininase family protein n=1 Tax=Oricola cellulosilytica TaxID=1429082 RepID=A0A4R0P9C4_9HYPH|nr:creatininase family protein [Oricola cellulosilytica]TCD11354.1 creatininase family protein [Oricola cellulosilytica]